MGRSSPSTRPGKPRLLTLPMCHEETEFAVIHFLPYVFQGIFYLARTVTLLQYKLCNNSLMSGICVVTPTILENIKKKKALDCPGVYCSLHIKRQALRLITLKGQNLDGLFCDASTSISALHFPQALNLALLCSLSKQGEVHALKK